MNEGIRVPGWWFGLTSLVLGTLLLAPPTGAAEETQELPTAAAAAVKKLYPDAEIVDVAHEREEGVTYYEVGLRDGDARIEMEVTADGKVGEIETAVVWKDVPEQIRQQILAETGGAKPSAVERHHVHGVPEGESFRRVDPPIELYEIEYEVAGERREISIASSGLVMMEIDTADDDDDSEDAQGGEQGAEDEVPDGGSSGA
jgi:hypothetical protein